MTSWFSHLERAKNAPEIVSVARDFLASWTPHELALLPPECRPGRLRDAEDVETLHSTLVEAYRVSRSTGKELEALQRLTSFIVRASIRLAEVAAGPSGGASASGAADSPRSAAPPES